MTKLDNNREINALALLLAFTYMTSYITRINYGAVISEIERSTEISRTLLSMAVTGSFITYGAGQVVSGIFGDKFSPKKLVLYGLMLTVAMNFIIPFCSGPYSMTTVWCVNGFAQSFMWPPIVKMMTSLLSAEDYKRTVIKVSWGGSMGTIVVYLISPIIISLSGWRGVFVFSVLCGVIAIFTWVIFARETGAVENVRVSGISKSGAAVLFSPVMLCIIAAIILQGILRDGVTTWMPSYIAQTYNMSNVISILTGVILPIFSIICVHITSVLYGRAFRNPLACAGVIFLTGAVSALFLYILNGSNAALSVVLSAVLTGTMHGVNLILISMIPAFFTVRGNVSTISGVLNCCTYIGSAISTYGIAAISENVGWSFTLLIWLIIAISGTALCLLSARPWNKFTEKKLRAAGADN